MANKLITNKFLREFLIRNEVYERYLNNLINRMKNRPDYSKINKLREINHTRNKFPIDISFTWSDTPEGDSFWHNLQEKYAKEMNNKMF